MAAIVTFQTHIAPRILHFFSLFPALPDNFRRGMGLFLSAMGRDRLHGPENGRFR
jgi:hypothetical protein